MLGLIKKLFNRPPTQRQFGPMALAALRKAWPDHTFTLDQPRFQIQHAGGAVLYLHNIHLDYCRADPSQRADQLDRFVRGVVAASPEGVDYDTAKGQLLPVLRNLSGIDLIRIEHGDDKPLSEVMTFRPMSGELGVAVAIDSELAITQIGGDVLKQWGISFDELLHVAVDNLRHKASPAFTEVGPGLFVSQYGDFYDAPRMLVPEIFWQLPLGSQPVAMVPNRSCMFVCGSENLTAMDDMVSRARPMLLEESRPLSGEMFKLQDGQWTSWCPPEAPGLSLRRLQREILAIGYAEQKSALDALHEKTRKDVFVGTQKLVQRDEDGQLLSYAVLTDGVHTLLPQADVLCLLFGEDMEQLMVRMSDFLDAAGAFVQPRDYVPPRYEVVRFPDAACIDRLRPLATTIAAAEA